jgi:hypothetical protein
MRKVNRSQSFLRAIGGMIGTSLVFAGIAIAAGASLGIVILVIGFGLIMGRPME